MRERRIYGAPEDNFLVQHGEKADGTKAVSVEIGTEQVGVCHTFTDPQFLRHLGEALIRAADALAARRPTEAVPNA